MNKPNTSDLAYYNKITNLRKSSKNFEGYNNKGYGNQSKSKSKSKSNDKICTSNKAYVNKNNTSTCLTNISKQSVVNKATKSSNNKKQKHPNIINKINSLLKEKENTKGWTECLTVSNQEKKFLPDREAYKIVNKVLKDKL
jgi:hypothetical protein